VTLITAPATQREPAGVESIRVESTHEMFEAVKKYFTRCDCLIMAAAVADYTPVHPAKTKTKKSERHLTIRLKPTPDILKWAGKHKKVKSKKHALSKAEGAKRKVKSEKVKGKRRQEPASECRKETHG
ncbi:MAG: phosphopantothenoylcysteine decarboxylase domain-containing protein, partial [Planctomycetota bacterium]